MAVPPTTGNGYQLWYYYPSVPGNVAVAAIFVILTLAHLVFIVKTKKKFCVPLVIGGIFEIIGYGFRTYAHYNITKTLPYAIQSLLILLAPILFAASVYMYLGRIVVASNGERQCPIPVKWLTKIFVTSDIICFLVQGAGGGLLSGAKTASRVDLGEHVILAGLVLQIVIFFVFVIVAGMFHLRMRSDAPASNVGRMPWQGLLVSLYCVSILIAARNIVRALEFGMGSSGYLLRHEWIIFVCDGAAMIGVLAIALSWYHGGVGAVNKHASTSTMDVEVMQLTSHNRK